MTDHRCTTVKPKPKIDQIASANCMPFAPRNIFGWSWRIAAFLLATAIIFGFGDAKNANASPLEWGSFSDITVNNAETGGDIVQYSAGTIAFRDLDGNLIENNPLFSLVYMLHVWGDDDGVPAGGLDGSGTSANGWVNYADGNHVIGLLDEETANQPGDESLGYWRFFVDLNRDGNYGTYDSANGVFIIDEGEEMSSIAVSGFDPFIVGPETLSSGTMSGTYNYVVPEPGTTSLLFLGAFVLIGNRRKRSSDKSTCLHSRRA